MSLVFAEQALEAAELAFKATCFKEAWDLLNRANEMWKRSVRGLDATPEFCHRVDLFTARSLELQASLGTARRAFPLLRAVV